MNAVEIEQAVSTLAEQPFDAAEFPYLFLQAFGNKETTLRRLRKGESNKSDFAGPLGGVLQTNNIHIAVAAPGEVTKTLAALRASPATARAKAKFILATDGDTLEAEDLATGETLACAYADFPNRFGFFLPLANISTVRQVRDSAFDIRATSRLNKLYIELLKDNPDWGSAERRHDMNHFMARLIFCFFAESTDIFLGDDLFTATIAQMSARDSSNTQEVIGALFRAMNTKIADRREGDIPRWADAFPYVNGGLFSGRLDAPRFSKIARSYLLHIGGLDWTKINPDIFGSMVQAVAEDEERGALGLHYTSVPNILKVLNPLFLDDLRTRLDEARDNPRMLLNLRRRMARIRVFDPACGSGNFLVIAYKEMRAIEAQINKQRGEPDRRSEIPLTNFRGIELRDFPAEIARLALIIAEYQCDVLYRGQKEALRDFLPLDAENWITCGNALRLDWLSICPPAGTGVKHHADDLFHTPLDQAQIDFENEGGETYICGNPPYLGSQDQSPKQKVDLAAAFAGAIRSTKSADYVSGWFIKARRYILAHGGSFSFVTTNSICQGRQVALFWPAILGDELEIRFAVPSFLWRNLASKRAAVVVSIVGVSARSNKPKLLFDGEQVQAADFIGPYLVPDRNTVVSASRDVISELTPMTNGSMPNDDGGLLMTPDEHRALVELRPEAAIFCHKFLGSHDSIQGDLRYCLWIADDAAASANAIQEIAERTEHVRKHRERSDRAETKALADVPYAFGERRHQEGRALLVPRHSSESRSFLPSVVVSDDTVIGDSAIAMYGFTMPDIAIYSSRMHLVWIATVCGKIKEDYRYSNTLGWNTFPVPMLTEKNKADLTRCAEDILLAREAHFPATIADLYDPDAMPADLREAHERNDETLERIYIGRRFRNDTERLECNVGFSEEGGKFQIEIKGLATPKSEEGQRICQEDLNEVIAAFVQDKNAIERGLFDSELVPEELTQVRMGKIIKDKYPELDEMDREAVRQHAVAALNLTQKAKEVVLRAAEGADERSTNTAFVEGVRRFAMDVRELDIDLIDRINPFGEAYAILAKSMNEESLRQVKAVIAGKRVNLTIEEARELAKRALKFKHECGRLPAITSPDAWEKRMAEGVAFLQRMKGEAARG